MSRVARGEDPALERKHARSIGRLREVRTLNDLAEALFEAAPSAGVRESTLTYWTWLHAKHLKPRLGGERLEDLAPGAARRVLRDIGAAAGPTTANRAHGLLRRILNFGVEEEHLVANPLAKLKPLFNEQSRVRVLADGELKALWGAAGKTTAPAREGSEERDDLWVSRTMAVAVLLCAVTLQRGGEVVGMTARELDREARTWLLPADRTKAGREHLVPLSDLAIRLIEEARGYAALRLGREPQGDDPIFPSPKNPTKPIARLSLSRAMARLNGVAGIENATPHDLRRTGATTMASERIGALSEVVARVLNHAPPGLGVTGIYNRHAYVAEKRRALDMWAGVLVVVVGERDESPKNVVNLGAWSGSV
jgi:integrase